MKILQSHMRARNLVRNCATFLLWIGVALASAASPFVEEVQLCVKLGPSQTSVQVVQSGAQPQKSSRVRSNHLRQSSVLAKIQSDDPVMQRIIGSRGKDGYSDRYQAVKELALVGLTECNYQTTIALLSENIALTPQSAVYEYAIRNELLIVLIDHAPDQQALGSAMLGWINDQS